MKKFIIPFFLLSFFSGCDPGYFGRTFIKNESSFELKLSYGTEFKDSILIIEPNSYMEVYNFGGLGEGRDYNCCSCSFLSISLEPTDSSKNLVKDISVDSNWNLTNDNRKRFSHHEITCAFVVKATDIQ